MSGKKDKAVALLSTKEAKDLMKSMMTGELGKGSIQAALAHLAARDPKAYLDSLAKLLPYVMPKQTSMEIEQKEIKSPAWFDAVDAEIVEDEDGEGND